jgi:hypothetical protein
VGSIPTFGIMNQERYEESRKELDAYRAYEMAKDKSLSLDTIFKATGGYRQGVVDARNASPKKENNKVIKKKTVNKTTRTTKMDRLRIEAEKNRPVGVRVVSEGRCEVEITTLYNSTMHKRMGGVRADYFDTSEPASPTVYMDNPHNLRVLAQALLMAADWMEGGK